ncbi:MAG: cation:proton antiporter domain-containing protein [Alphaproteobacteria bacterium]
MGYHLLDIALVIMLATLAAVFLSRLQQQPIVGYVLAGVVIGPAMLGLIGDESQISFMAELGVILLLFILGMEMPIKAFRKTYKLALSVTLGLTGLSIALTFALGFLMDLSFQEKIVYGFILSLSSTAVAVKLLMDTDLMQSLAGQIAISVLITQDLLFVPMIMLTNALGTSGAFNMDFLLRLVAALGILIITILFLSRKKKVHLLFEKSVEQHKDLIPVAALAWCFLAAALSQIAGLSPAFGAFLSGLVIGNSYSKEKVLPKIEPMQSVMIMVFFLSIGMLLDFQVIAEHFKLILLLLFGTMFFKTVISILILKFFLPQERWRYCFVTGLSIGQIGEFSFILAAAALASGIFDNESYKIIIAVIALSLSISPLWASLVNKFFGLSYVEKSTLSLRKAMHYITLNSPLSRFVKMPTK